MPFTLERASKLRESLDNRTHVNERMRRYRERSAQHRKQAQTRRSKLIKPDPVAIALRAENARRCDLGKA